MSSTYTKASRPAVAHGMVVNSPSDPFLAQYIKTPNLNSSLNNHQLYFNSINQHRKIKLIEIYQKYLINTTPYVVPHFKPKSPISAAVKVTRVSPVQHQRKQDVPQIEEKAPVKTKPASPLQVIKKHLPAEFMDCPIDDLITLITRMMLSLISLNDKSVPASISKPSTSSSSSSSNSLLTRYHSRTPPSISTHTYLTRLTKFNNFNAATLLTTIYYIDLLSHQYQPFFTLNSWTVHRFLLVGTMLAQKSMEDFFYTNDHYAKVGGVAISELNCLELDFLERVDWRCMPGKHLDTPGESSIKYAKDVLNLYYSQLIELMGKNLTTASGSRGNIHIHYLPGTSATSSPTKQITPAYSGDSNDDSGFDEDEVIDDTDYDSNEDEDDDDYGVDDEEDVDVDVEDSDADQVVSFDAITGASLKKYNSRGYSNDGSSSPHLKRKRYDGL
ncbi:cyclin-domain-containing protein [Suhomyces tanzawaensis NRRL Y-17324]|uniref:Cyclin-domain-containing protein n=1 Tax=Suhomyces tanzawaensis NRRL Y-17324 TaxID=984487 RepID=A0A1E4SCT7_9ASCO|nr:cyclin-domain-containing protein [Suhomyces tanzawaensis NRRL Y-17324]ODV77331.1 cyclin-domain-containing protein [Suhomyces tanzawaensis NRRL Y-17324]